MNKDTRRILVAAAAIVAAVASFAVTRMSTQAAASGASECCNWFEGVPQSVTAMNADFNTEAAYLDQTLVAEQLRLQSVLDDPCSPDEAVLLQAEKVSLAHAALTRRAGRHVIAMREALPKNKCSCFMQFSAGVVCGSGRGASYGGGQGRGRGRRRSAGAGRVRRGRCGFACVLALNDAQLNSLAEKDPSYEQDLESVRQQVFGARDALGEAMATEDVSDDRLLELLDEMLAAHGRLDRRVAEHVVIMRTELTIGQQKMLIGLSGRRCAGLGSRF